MAKKSKEDLSDALANLREELRQDTREISASIEQLKAADGAADDTAAIANSLQALRQELRHEVNTLSQQIEQAQLEHAQSMLVTPEADTTEFTSAVSSLQEELHRNVFGLGESIEQLKASTASYSQVDSDAVAGAIEALREDVRDETNRLSQRIEQARSEQSERGSIAPVVDTSEFSTAVHDLRGEVKRDVQHLSQAIARNEPPPKGPPIATVLTALVAVAAGALGMAFYQHQVADDSTSRRLSALDTKVETLAEQDLKKLLEEAQSDEAASEQEAIDRLNDTVIGLRNLVDTQEQKLDKVHTGIAEGLRSELEMLVKNQLTIVGRPSPEASPPSPPEDDAAGDPTAGAVAAAGDQPDNAGAEAAGAEAAGAEAAGAEAAGAASVTGDTATEAGNKPAAGETAAGDAAAATGEPDPGAGGDSVAVEPPAEQPLDKVQNVQSPAQAKLIIDNPSRFDIQLKINGEEVDVAARGVTTVPVTQGMVTTEIGSYAQEWDDWEVVEGEPRLKIRIESGTDYYKLLRGGVATASE